ncbi:MAG TPA: DNA polymerase ligase N-terminal domain-containing protein [Candidatus Acidoferrales bacterium]
MTLKQYRKKRRFDVTPEPSGSEAGSPESAASESTSSEPISFESGRKASPALTYPVAKTRPSLRYVIQKHRASQLHYDFRLEWNGVLLSWAVPKGPSLDPSVKRLAMQVEDHPIDYADFEGVIPEGEYGGGTVMVWDSWTWTPEQEDVEAALRKGDLKFTLHGTKLKGSWVLVRTRGYGSRSKQSWLLIKHRDRYASAEDIAAREPQSVASRRLLADIAREGGGDITKAATGDPVSKSKSMPRARQPVRSGTKSGARPGAKPAAKSRRRAK